MNVMEERSIASTKTVVIRQVPKGMSLKDILLAIRAEIGVGVPNLDYLLALSNEMMSMHVAMLQQAESEIAERRSTGTMGDDPNLLANEIKGLSEEIQAAVARKIASLTNQPSVTKDRNSVDSGAVLQEDEPMNTVPKEVLDARLETIETRMDGRISTLEAKIDSKFADLKADIHKGTSELVKWVVGTAIAMAAVAITVMTFVLNNAIPKAPPAASPAPIVIYAQPITSTSTQPQQQPNAKP